ncbi:MAG TPA: T9SS type A sorting domain-containing protein [Candidatus Cloacimonadota bacterium]|nr:T9SS type A sorting domain-containing protein [Candidatus Cloacimonadota bacterium]HPT70798.1 T9SS type A sorting domain-containing protein [Candidatus Cloacimonadota bacterium]
MKRIGLLSIFLLLITFSAFAQARAYYQKVEAQDGSDILSLVTGTGASYTAPNYTIMAMILEVPTEYLVTGITPTTSLRLVKVGNGSTVPYYAAVYVQLGSFPTQWVAGETLHIMVTKTDVAPVQTVSWDYVIPAGTSTINILDPVQYIPPLGTENQAVISSFGATPTAQMFVNLEWSSEIESNLIGYNIYRSDDNNLGNTVLINESIIPGTNTSSPHNYTFEDVTTLPSTTYYYWLGMLYMDGSTEHSDYITVTTDPIGAIPNLVSFTLEPSTHDILEFVEITWTTSSETDVFRYRIYWRNELENMQYHLLNMESIMGTNTSSEHTYSYVQQVFETNLWYYYYIEMEKTDGSLYRSQTDSIWVFEISNPDVPEPIPVTNIDCIYPNPFNNNGNVNFNISVKQGETATLSIYNVLGQQIRKYDVQTGANQVLYWDGKDSHGISCGSGIYFCKLSSPTSTSTRKIVMMK